MKSTWLNFLCLFCFLTPLFAQAQFMEVANSGLEAFSGNEGIAVGDYDNDGFEDLYVSVPLGPNRLCKNLGNGEFEEMGEVLGVAIEGQSVASTWGDINNDGFLDLYISVVNENDFLFLNNGDGNFENITASAGIDNLAIPKSVNMADVNNDGFLDIYVSNFQTENVLYLNQGNNTFIDNTLSSGALDTGPSMANIFFDYDQDGDIDLYLVHDQLQPNILYQNDGTGVFAAVSEAAGVNFIGFGMGVDVGDINNDGWLDIYITNLYQNALLTNNGDGTFTDISTSAGINDDGMGWGTSFLDYNKDGLVDIYVANESNFFNPPTPNVLYKNLGNSTFEKVELNGAISNTDNSFGVACFDYNLDGNIDFAVANRGDNEHLQLFENPERTGTWVGVKLIGIESNRGGIGAKVKITDNLGNIHFKELSAGHGWASQNSSILFFGLGAATTVTDVTIDWPSGLTQNTTLELLDRNYTIAEGLQPQEGILFEVATSTEDVLAESFQVDVYPNPVKDNITISFSLEENASLQFEFINSLGQQVFLSKDENFSSGEQLLSFDKNNFDQLFTHSFLILKTTIKNQQVIKKIMFTDY